MKKILLIACLAAALGCSKEKKQQHEENLLVQAMVNGQWKVTGFNKGGTDITGDFAVYKFQFKSDLTVDAINNGSVEKTGTWNGDVAAQTITSNFTNASPALTLLNGTWTISNTTLTSVQANQTVSGELRTLRLDKQ
jgi:hypothetical protein